MQPICKNPILMPYSVLVDNGGRLKAWDEGSEVVEVKMRACRNPVYMTTQFSSLPLEPFFSLLVLSSVAEACS